MLLGASMLFLDEPGKAIQMVRRSFTIIVLTARPEKQTRGLILGATRDR
jgi:hypothetical protein